MAGIQEIGVTAVVKGLTAFLGDLRKIDQGLKGIAPSGNFITQAFSSLGSVLSSVGREILNIAEFALGHLLADAIEFVIGKIRELISATIQAGAEFQTMGLRLNRLNFNDIIEGGGNLATAMDRAKEATKEQLTWIQKLAVATPFDAQDIANVYTLARSYNFADQAARGITEDISDFAAGMGLGGVEIERIIVNFGQMVQQGKVTQREMNDLARGAFVPVNDVLERMQKNVGLSDSAFKDFRQTGEGVQEFFKAFSQIVEERFQGAAQDMARTFQGATANAQDFVKSLIGMNVVKPILDKVGGAIADLIKTLTEPEKWDILTVATQRLGGEIIKLFEAFTGIKGLDTAGIFWGIVKAIGGITNWIQSHRDDIVNFFKGIGTTIQTKVLPFIQKVVDAFNTIRKWVSDHGETIRKFFETLGEIVSTVFSDLTGGKIQIGGGLQGFLDGITSFMNYVIENKDTIIPWVEGFIKLFLAVQAVGFVFGILFNIAMAIISPFLAFIGIVIGLIGVVSVLGPLLGAIGTFILTILIPAIIIGVAIFAAITAGILAAFAAGVLLRVGFDLLVAKIVEFATLAMEQFTLFKDQTATTFEEVKNLVIEKVTELYNGAVAKFEELLAAVRQIVENVKNAWTSVNWYDIGVEIMDGIKRAIINKAQTLIDQIVKVVQKMYDAAMATIGAHSPSRLFMKVGKAAIQGMAKGIEGMAGDAIGSMKSAVSQIVLPAYSIPAMAASGATNQNTYNYSLNINTNASAEPILQDYNMLRSLAEF